MARMRMRVAVGVAMAAMLAVVASVPSRAQVPAHVPEGVVALTGARVLDGTGRAPIEQATLVIHKGRVQAVGPARSVQIPAGAIQINVAGKTIMPGIISGHMHIALQGAGNTFALDERQNWPVRDQLLEQLRLYADDGVTTIFTFGEDAIRGFREDNENDLRELIKLRDEQWWMQQHGALDRARVYMSGVALNSLGAAAQAGATEAAARQQVDQRADIRVDVLKVGPPGRIEAPIWTAIIDQAHKRGLRVVAHVTNLPQAKMLVNAGLDAIVHAIRDKPEDVVDDELIRAMKRRNVGYISTFTQTYSRQLYETTPAFFTDPFFLRHIDYFRAQVEAIKDPAFQEKARKEAPGFKTSLEVGMKNIIRMRDAGIVLGLGTDSGGRRSDGNWSGYHEHVEMELYVKAGLTPMQALVAATQGSARVHAIDDEVGTLQPGKWADLLVLNANPLEDIRNTRQIDQVWIAGRRLSRQMGTH